MLKLNLQYFGYLMWRADSLEKTLMLGKIEVRKKRGIISCQFSSIAQLCLTLYNLMDCSMPGLSVPHQLLELAQTHVH